MVVLADTDDRVLNAISTPVYWPTSIHSLIVSSSPVKHTTKSPIVMPASSSKTVPIATTRQKPGPSLISLSYGSPPSPPTKLDVGSSVVYTAPPMSRSRSAAHARKLSVSSFGSGTTLFSDSSIRGGSNNHKISSPSSISSFSYVSSPVGYPTPTSPRIFCAVDGYTPAPVSPQSPSPSLSTSISRSMSSLNFAPYSTAVLQQQPPSLLQMHRGASMDRRFDLNGDGTGITRPHLTISTGLPHPLGRSVLQTVPEYQFQSTSSSQNAMFQQQQQQVYQIPAPEIPDPEVTPSSKYYDLRLVSPTTNPHPPPTIPLPSIPQQRCLSSASSKDSLLCGYNNLAENHYGHI